MGRARGDGMTVIHPCRLCPLRNGCDLREQYRRRVRGLGAASVRFSCPKLAAEIRGGRRIAINVPRTGENRWGEPSRVSSKQVYATITSAHADHSFGCIVDPGQIDEDDVYDGVDPNKIRFRRIQKHHRIVRFLDEPDGAFCGLGALMRDGKCDTMDGGCTCRDIQKFS